MILTDEQKAGWEAELATYNAEITRSNISITEHNAILPPEIPQVPLRALLTLDEYIQLKLDEIARAGANKARAEAKTPLQLLAEHDAMVIQLQAVTDDKTRIEAARVQLVADLAAKTAEYDSTKASLDAKETELTASKDENTKLSADHAEALVKLVAAHKTELTQKETALTEANATIAALEARVASLLAELPFNPKIIDATAFYNRITKEEFAELLTSDDANKVNIGNTIMVYVKNDWPIVFESPEFQGMIGYLLSTGFPAERVAQLTADATRAEAYDAA